MQLYGIHHLTAITANAPGIIAFNTDVLGMRLVKKTVKQDDVTAYHLFYADGQGVQAPTLLSALAGGASAKRHSQYCPDRTAGIRRKRFRVVAKSLWNSPSAATAALPSVTGD